MAKKAKPHKAKSKKPAKAPQAKASKLSGLKKLLLGSNKKTPAPKASPKKAIAKPAVAKKGSPAKPAQNAEVAKKGNPAPAKVAAAAKASPVVKVAVTSPVKGGKVTVLKNVPVIPVSSLRSSKKDAGEVCREIACDMLATSVGYCRMHYIKNWKKIKQKEILLKERKLDRYIEELVAKYPDKYIEAIRTDLVNDKDFLKVVRDLEIVETSDEEETTVEAESSTEAESFVDSIRKDFGTEESDF